MSHAWKRATLHDLVELQRGYDLPSQDRLPGNIPVMGGGGLNGFHAVANVKGPGVVIGRSGAGFGTAFYSEDDFWAHNTVLFVKNFNGNDTNYVYHFLKWFDFSTYNSGGAQPSLNRNFIYPIEIEIPPLPEQTAIASVLSTWDLSIEKTERLIAAKEKWFTSLTQELIHNCTEGLRHVYLRDICEPITRKNSVNELNVLTTSAQHGLISQMDYYKKSVSAEDVRGYYLLKKGEFAYNRSSSNGYPYGAIKRLEDYPQGVLSTLYLCFSLRTDAPCDSDFMAHAFEAGLLNKQLVGVCQEGARSHGLLNITKADFFSLKMALPAINEQRKIAAILTTARQEIDLLKQQADACRRQKRGLMQKLLTGQWRVRSMKENS
ncbi:restriction endonuclease subunit S [Trichlorobacter lovleyi]|uniref:restriction endonuclease subunit S n=1 Tax=Trichlorobacter lovleyi TaxID=313985 RepID=UPI00223F6D4E|nr:restriction endonuclease subunit S [Trichlorobacter lovleyi]QOX80483.1 restriction endonuclease subunit S [Trichlorobacter lovleyi]